MDNVSNLRYKIIKKLMTVFFAVVVVFTAEADTWKDSQGYTWTYTINGPSAEILKCSPQPTDNLTIPSTLGGKPVTGIGYEAFIGSRSLTSVAIPVGVTELGDRVFYNCTHLSQVTIPDSVDSIGNYAFYNCSEDLFDTTTIPGLKLVDGWVIGTSTAFSGYADLTNARGVAGGAFLRCSGLTGVMLPSKITRIGAWTFSECSGLTDITIPYSVTDIGLSAFEYCSGLTSVNIPHGVKNIGDQAFQCCEGLINVTISDSVTNIGNSAFYYCSNLSNIEIPDSVKTIGGAAFSTCDDSIYDTTTIPGVRLVDGWAVGVTTELPKKVNLNGLRGIAAQAFFGCSKLTDVTIGGNITDIGSKTFFGCSGLKNITIGDGVTHVGDKSFYGCTALKNVVIPDSVVTVGSNAFEACSGLASVVLGSGMVELGDEAFKDCNSLSRVTIPVNVTNIGSHVFIGCTNLKMFAVAPDNMRYMGNAGMLLSKDGKTLELAPSGVEVVSLPNIITDIAPEAFYYCKALARIEIPYTVTNIGDRAFYGCYGLKDMVVPKVICSSPLCVNFPNSYNYITNVVISEGTKDIVRGLFDGCANLKSVVMPDGLETIGDYAFGGCEKLSSIVIPESVENLGIGIFDGCRALSSAVFLGNAPNVGQGQWEGFGDLSDETFALYVLKDTTGWGDEIPGTWNNYPVRYFKGIVIKFNANGGVASKTNLILDEGATLSDLPTVAREGHAFLGWFTSPDGGVNVMVDTVVTTSATYHAQWKVNQYTMTFDANGGTGGKSVTQNFGTELSAPIVTRMGYTFKGWLPSVPTTVPAANTTYTAQWICDWMCRTNANDELEIIGATIATNGVVTIPAEIDGYTVTGIASGAFKDCSGITSVVIPDNVTKVEVGTFNGCTNIVSVRLPVVDAVPTEPGFYEAQFTGLNGWDGNMSIMDNVRGIKLSADMLYTSSIGSYTMYAYGAFMHFQEGLVYYFSANYDDYSSIKVDDTLVAGPASGECQQSTGNISFPSSGWHWIELRVYNHGASGGRIGSGLVWWTGDDSTQRQFVDPGDGSLFRVGTSYCGVVADIFPDSFETIQHMTISGEPESIPDGFLAGCGGLTSVELPNTVAVIGNNAFDGCASLASITIPPAVTHIGASAFAGCSSLTGVTIPDGVTHIGSAAFASCGNLMEVVIPQSVWDVGEGAFADCANLRRVEAAKGLKGTLEAQNVFEGCPADLEIVYVDTATISNVTAKQRYPWNGKVDITYTLTGDVTAGLPAWNMPRLFVTASNRVDGTTYAATTSALSGDTDIAEGPHHVVWDLNAQELDIYSDDVVFNVMYLPHSRYCVIELSAGSNAASYPVSYLADVPSGGFNTDEYKTTKLVLRLVGPGTFMMGGSYQVTLTKPFYCGVFEVTQKQYELVTGANPSSYKGDLRPVERVSWNTIRGYSSTYNWPGSASVDSNSFVGRLQARTGLNFDLPTEVQWEYACRAGTTSTYNNGGGTENDLRELGRYSGDKSDGKGEYTDAHTKVGSYEPNAWGLYDMHGNVWEWCLDWYGNLANGVTDPEGSSSGSYRVSRGGGWVDDGDFCASSYRGYSLPSNGSNGYYGFRLVRTLSNTEGERSPEAAAGAERVDALCAAEAAPVAIDSRVDVEPVLDSVAVAWDAVWIGGDANATVVISDNGTEVRRTTGAGEFTYAPSIGRHELTYTTYIGGVAQDEVYTATVYAKWKYEVVDGGAIITETTQKSGSVTIPPEIDGYTVTGIGADVFAECTDLTSVVIPESVEAIAENAFAGCTGIRQLSLPWTVQIGGGQCGLVQAKFNKSDDFTSSILDSDTCANVSGVLMGYAYDTSSATQTFTDPVYGGSFKWNGSYTTFGYLGLMYMEAGRTYVFGKYFDDSVYVKIDGTQVLRNTNHETFATGSYESGWTGWHEIEVRVADGTGYKGPKGAQSGYTSYWGATMGIGWRDDGVTAALPESGWRRLMDPGDGSLLRLPGSSQSALQLNLLIPDSYANLQSVTLTGTTTEIPAHAFEGCAALTDIEIPASVGSIGENAFAGCASLTELTIPASVTNIAAGAFANCPGVVDVTLPTALLESDYLVTPPYATLVPNAWIKTGADADGTVEYRSNAIGHNQSTAMSMTISGPRKLTFSWKVSSESGYDFLRWSLDGVQKESISGTDGGWREVTTSIPEGEHTIVWTYSKDGSASNGADCGWVRINVSQPRLVQTGGMTLQDIFPDDCQNLRSVTLTGPMTEMTTNTFAGCTSLTNVTIPGSVTRIAPGTFDDCTALESIDLPGGLTDWGLASLPPAMREAYAYDANGLMIVYGWLLDCQDRTLSDLVVPEGVIGIGNYALAQMVNLQTVSLPGTLRHIADSAFREDTYLDDVTLPAGLETIAPYAFADCSYLQNLSPVTAVKSVGAGAFSGCSQLSGIVFGEGLGEIGPSAFEGCWRMLSAVLPLSVTNVSATAFNGCTGLTGVTVPTHCGKMSEWFASAYTEISDVIVPGGETEVCEGMFAGCANLAAVSLPEGIAVISDRAFKDCGSLTEMTLPSTCETLGEEAFSGCSALETLTLSRGLGEIPDRAFSGCWSLSSLVVPAAVTNLGTRIVSSGMTAVYFLGNAPACAEGVYYNADSELTSYVVQGTLGWDGRPTSRDIPQTWNDRAITTWEANRFDVTFDAAGGVFPGMGASSCVCAQVTGTGYALPSSEPTRAGYTFGGWWTEKSGGARITSSTRVTLTKAHALYARWAADRPVTVRFNAAGGSVLPSMGEYAAGAEYGVLPVPSREHYEFAGWYTEATGGERILETSVVQDADHELFARWTARWYAVRFNANGGTGQMDDQLFTIGVEQGLAANAFTRAGYAFSGWGTTPDGVVVYSDGETVSGLTAAAETTVELYAVWQAKTVAAPVVSPPDGTYFTDDSCTVTLSCATPGATIYYSPKGVTPRITSAYQYTGPFTIADTATIKAVAVLDGVKSEYVTATITKRALTLAEAAGAPDLAFTTGGDAEWTPEIDATSPDGYSAQSGTIGDAVGAPYATSWLQTVVGGAGTISFRWKVVCEWDESGDMSWDRAVFFTNGVEAARMDGTSGWKEISFTFADAGSHALRWQFQKDDYNAEEFADHAWVSGIVWTPRAESPTEPIPPLPTTATDSEVAAALAGSGDANLLAAVTTAAQYATYRTWALSVTNDVLSAQNVKDSAHTWLSYALGADRLVTKELANGEVKIESFSSVPGADGFRFEVSIQGVNIGGGFVEAETLKANMGKVFGVEGSATLSPAAFSSDGIDITFDEPQNGKARFTATPPSSAGDTYFMRVKVK